MHESAIGPKRTSLAAPHMSAFGGKADMIYCGIRFHGRCRGQSGHGLYKKVAALTLRLFFFA
jgi:hypothetical protein